MKQRTDRSKEYAAWTRMRRRCRSSPYYAAIKIDPRWDCYRTFRQDMGKAPTAKHTLGRVDNSKGYSPDNCAWETWEQQANNKSNSSQITIFGETKTMAQWSRDHRCRVSLSAFTTRIVRGWGNEEALTLPPGSNGGVKRGGPHTPATIEKIRQAAFKQHQRTKTYKENIQ